MRWNSLRAAQRHSQAGTRRSFLGLGVLGVGISLEGLRKGQVWRQKANPGGAEGVGMGTVGEQTPTGVDWELEWDFREGVGNEIHVAAPNPGWNGSASLSRSSSPSGVTFLIS